MIGTILLSLLSGGATGILGVIVQRIADYKNKQLDLERADQDAKNALAAKRVDLEIMEKEYQGKDQIARTEAAGREAVADSQAFAASFSTEPKLYSEGQKLTPAQRWVTVLLDALRGSIRPILTIYLCGITTLVYWQAQDVLAAKGAILTPIQAYDVLTQIIATILYLTTTCILWWFGTRNKQKPPGDK